MVQRAVETTADQLFYTTVFISTITPLGPSTGTGFLINYPDDENTFKPVLITNKHVFDGATTATFTMPAAGSSPGIPSGGGTQMTIEDFSTEMWVGHPDPSVDVCAMFFAVVIQAMISNGGAPFYRGFGPEQLATQETAESLDAIEQITMIGYPNGLFDRSSFLPIARRGQTATPIFNDYNGWPAFLIDASVFPGSSGSPVVLFDRGTYTLRDGSTLIGSRMILLGVVAAVHTRQVQGEVHMVSAGIATFNDMIDLGIVYKASAIQETVLALFAAAGINIAPAVVSPEELA